MGKLATYTIMQTIAIAAITLLVFAIYFSAGFELAALSILIAMFALLAIR